VTTLLPAVACEWSGVVTRGGNGWGGMPPPQLQSPAGEAWCLSAARRSDERPAAKRGASALPPSRSSGAPSRRRSVVATGATSLPRSAAATCWQRSPSCSSLPPRRPARCPRAVRSRSGLVPRRQRRVDPRRVVRIPHPALRSERGGPCRVVRRTRRVRGGIGARRRGGATSQRAVPWTHRRRKW